jgi:hypothetical protein
MSDPTEKQRRKELKREYKAKERDAILSSLPVSSEAIAGLFDHVDTQLQNDDCDDTLRISIEFAEESNWDVDGVVEWLRSNGGYCDCEVLMNVEELLNNE